LYCQINPALTAVEFWETYYIISELSLWELPASIFGY